VVTGNRLISLTLVLAGLLSLGATEPASAFNIFPSLGGSRSGTAAMTFLRITAGARAAAMAGAYSAICTDAFSLYHNPAGAVWAEKDNIAFAHRFWVADISHNFIGITKHLGENNIIGLSLTSLTTDPIAVTDEYHPFGTGETVDYSDLAIGGSYSVRLTDYFSFGLTIKYAQENLADLKMQATLIDLGTLYHTDFYGTRFAINMANFGPRLKPAGNYDYRTVSGELIRKEYQSFSPPTVFKVSVAFDPLADNGNKLSCISQLNHPTDNAENIAFGLEYSLNDRLFLRGGYLVNSRVENLSLGGGLKIDLPFAGFSFDYAYTGMNDLGGTSNLSLVLGF